MLRTLLLVAFGGAVGSVFRYLTAVFANKYFHSNFPSATFITNIVGCFLIGIILGWLEKNQLADSGLKWFLVTGFCGGYTTFSTFGHENVSLLQSGNPALALAYIGASVIVGLAAVWLGLFLSQ